MAEHVRPPRKNYRDNESGVGWMIHVPPGLGNIAVEHTVENDHFFLYKPQKNCFEVMYQSSAEIATVLSMWEEGQRITRAAVSERLPHQGQLSLIDRRGHFYNFVTLKALPREEVEHYGVTFEKHTPVLDIRVGATDTYNTVAMPVDDIYCIAPTAHPVTWEGDDT